MLTKYDDLVSATSTSTLPLERKVRASSVDRCLGSSFDGLSIFDFDFLVLVLLLVVLLLMLYIIIAPQAKLIIITPPLSVILSFQPTVSFCHVVWVGTSSAQTQG